MSYDPASYSVSEPFLKAFHRIGAKQGDEYGDPPAKKLSLLLRPAFIADPGKTLVWGDFSNIEARVLPWLAASPGAEAKLEIFREVDRDPTLPDVYVRTAGDLLEEDPQELWNALGDKEHPDNKHAKDARQSHGKVPELSLGFGGGLGALQKMAVAYGVYLDDNKATEMVAKWREKNAWAKAFWGQHGRQGSFGVWGAINSAIESPNTIMPIGRVAYVFDPDYMGGTLFCGLPCGRLLTYPAIKWEWREVEDKATKKIRDVYQLTYLKGYGRKALWYGIAVENITQAGAASVLRRTLKRLEYEVDFGTMPGWAPVVMHTHDEIVLEADEEDWKLAARVLQCEMNRNDDWDAGLPLASEITTSWFYSKSVEGLKPEEYAA